MSYKPEDIFNEAREWLIKEEAYTPKINLPELTSIVKFVGDQLFLMTLVPREKGVYIVMHETVEKDLMVYYKWEQDSAHDRAIDLTEKYRKKYNLVKPMRSAERKKLLERKPAVEPAVEDRYKKIKVDETYNLNEAAIIRDEITRRGRHGEIRYNRRKGIYEIWAYLTSVTEEEIIRRQIFVLEQKIKQREDIIKAHEIVIEHLETLRLDPSRYDELRHAISELGLTPIEGLEDLIARGIISSLKYSIMAYKSWIVRWKKAIKELIEKLPPFRYERYEITFSIETDAGHQKPFMAEVTAETIVERGSPPPSDRIVNACIKYFWIMFDAFKDLRKDHKVLLGVDEKGISIYDKILKLLIWMQKHANVLEEEKMDNLLIALEDIGAFGRNPEEYITCQAILKIGLTPYYTTETQPAYPKVDLTIEKTKPTRYVRRIQLIIAKETDFYIMDKLDMRMEE